MELARGGAEYIYWTVATKEPLMSEPFVAFVRKGVKLDESAVWYAAEWEESDPATVRTVRLLVAGPDVDPVPPGGIRLRSGTYQSHLRFAETPEIVIRGSEGLLTVA